MKFVEFKWNLTSTHAVFVTHSDCSKYVPPIKLRLKTFSEIGYFYSSCTTCTNVNENVKLPKTPMLNCMQPFWLNLVWGDLFYWMQLKICSDGITNNGVKLIKKITLKIFLIEVLFKWIYFNSQQNKWTYLINFFMVFINIKSDKDNLQDALYSHCLKIIR